MMLHLSASGASVVWKKKEVKSKFQQAILDSGFLYANSDGRVKCLGWPDGGRKWEAGPDDGVPIGENGSIVRAGDKLLGMSDDGMLLLLARRRKAYPPRGARSVPTNSETWATPLLVRRPAVRQGDDGTGLLRRVERGAVRGQMPKSECRMLNTRQALRGEQGS